MSLRNSLTRHNYSPSGFQQIPENHSTMNQGDVSIQMEPVRTMSQKTSGSRRAGERSPMALPVPAGGFNEKKPGHFHGLHRHRRSTTVEGQTAMGRIYDKIKNFSIVTRYLLYVIPVGLILLVPIVILDIPSIATYSSTQPDGSVQRYWIRWGGVRAIWVFVWIEVFWCALWGAKLASKVLPAIFQFLCGIVSPGVRKYKSVLKRLEVPISLAIWFAVGIVTFDTIIVIDAQYPVDAAKPSTSQWLPTKDLGKIKWASTFNKVLLAFLGSSLVFLGEQFIIQLISISYHHTQYEEKIRKSKHNVDILTLLYEASTSLFPAYCIEFAEEDYIINDSPELPKALLSTNGTAKRRSGHGTPMRLIQNVGRFGDKVTTVFGNIASEVTGKQVFNPMASHSIIVEALEKKRSCEALARRIWMSLVVEGRDALYLEDVQEVLADHGKWNAEDVFGVLDKDANGDVSLDEMIMTVTEFGRERKAIASSLHDVDQAIKVLDRLLLFLVLLLCVFVFVLILSPSTTASLTGVGTSLLSLSFVFAVTTQEILGSCIFLFVKHPYDVGDRVDINGQQLVVERISLLFTIFKSISTGKLTQSPNIVLNTLWVENVSRSGAMKEQITMNIDFSTTIEDIDLLRNEMQNFVLDRENSRDFQPDIIVEVTGVSDLNKMELKVEIRHKSNWHNETLRATRRSKFMCALVMAIRKVPINQPGGSDAALGSADRPTWSVAISPDEGRSARQTYTDGKDAKKLINVQKEEEEKKNGASSTGADSKFLSPDGNLRNRKDGGAGGPGGLTMAAAAETAAAHQLNSRSAQYEDSESGNEWAGQAPGRPAIQHSKSPVRADSQRMRELNSLYGELSKSPSTGKRRESYKLNVTAASPTSGLHPVYERDLLAPSVDSSSPLEPTFSGEQSTGPRRRSGSPSGRTYSPLNHEQFDHGDPFHSEAWNKGAFMDIQGHDLPEVAPVPAPTLPASRYVTPPAKAEETILKHPAYPGSPQESWLDRDSAAYGADSLGNIVASPVEAAGSAQPSRGQSSARASSVALGSLPEEPSPPLPRYPLPKQMHSAAASKAVSRQQSGKSSKSWARNDDQEFI